MKRNDDLIAAIDAFMAATKTLVGVDTSPVWRPGFTQYERVMKYPIEVAGEQKGAQLMLVSFPAARALKFRVGVLFSAMICRLDYTDETHGNTLTGVAQGLPDEVEGPHYHSWRLNRRFFRGVSDPPKLRDAELFEVAAQSFDAILRWFCADVHIDPLPPNHRIELPTPDRLF